MSVTINGEEVVDGLTESEKAEAEKPRSLRDDEKENYEALAHLLEVGDEDESVGLHIEIEGEESATSEEDAEIEAGVNAEGAPEWVKKLRAKQKEDSRKAKELERKLAELSKPVQKDAPELGEKPTLESCDFDGDKFEADLLAWNERKAQFEAKESEKVAESQALQKQYDDKLNAYNAAGAKFDSTDGFEDAKQECINALNLNQQGMAIMYAKDPATLTLVLGRNPALLAKLASINDPLQFVAELRELENKVKITKKPKTAPEQKLSGNGKVEQGGDKQLDKLREEAERTGDYTKVSAYKRQMREQAAKK